MSTELILNKIIKRHTQNYRLSELFQRYLMTTGFIATVDDYFNSNDDYIKYRVNEDDTIEELLEIYIQYVISQISRMSDAMSKAGRGDITKIVDASRYEVASVYKYTQKDRYILSQHSLKTKTFFYIESILNDIAADILYKADVDSVDFKKTLYQM